MHRPALAAFLVAVAAIRLGAQAPPVDVVWSALLPYGSGDTGCRVSIDGEVTAWSVHDDDMVNMTLDKDVVWRYGADGLCLEGAYPYTYFSCGDLDHGVAFLLRNDSTWALLNKTLLSGGHGFCVQLGSGFDAESIHAPTADAGDFASAMWVDGTVTYVTAWRDSSATSTDHHRILALNEDGTLLWERFFPPAQFNRLGTVVVHNGLLAVADFPDLHWFDPSDGSLAASLTLYPGSTASGDLHVRDGELYWACSGDDGVHYGKLDGAGAALWSGSLAVGHAQAITVDDQGRMWIAGGQNATPGSLVRVASDGSLADAYTYGHTITDVAFANGRLAFTGQFTPNDPGSFLIVGMPQP